MRKTQNPVFSKINVGTTHYEDVDAASYKGVVIKTTILLAITIVIAALTAYALPVILVNNVTGFAVALFISGIVGFICAMVGRISARKAKYMGVIYAACQGLFLGALTGILDLYAKASGFEGIAPIAIFSTLLIFSVMLILYATGILRTGSFLRKLVMVMGIGALTMIPLVALIGVFVPTIYNNLPLMIGLEAFLLIYGAITLLFNFEEANIVVKQGLEKEYEWSVSLGLIISILYIYVEVLRIIALIIASSNRD